MSTEYLNLTPEGPRTAPGPANWQQNTRYNGAIHVRLLGAANAVVTVEGSNDKTCPVTLFTSTLLTGGPGVGDGFAEASGFEWLRLNVISCDGGSQITADKCCQRSV